MQWRVFEAFRAIDIPEDKALKAAAALSKRDDDVASLKTDTSHPQMDDGLCAGLSGGDFRQVVLALTISAECERKRPMFRACAPLPLWNQISNSRRIAAKRSTDAS